MIEQNIELAGRPIHAVDFTIVGGERTKDFSALIGNTLFVDVMPTENCTVANLDYCAGREVTITFDNRDPAQSYRARVLWTRLKALDYPPVLIVANTPTDTFMLFVETNRTAKAHIYEEKTP
jgi:hypothetical protein